MQKSKSTEPVLVYRDEIHEARTRQELETARQQVQTILDEWTALHLGPLIGINELILRPRVFFDKAVDAMILTPESKGAFKLDKAKYRDQLTLPDPSALIAACKKALQLPWCAVYPLWIVNDETIDLDAEAANEYINSQSLYATSPEAIALVTDLIRFCELFTSLNNRIAGEMLPSFNPGFHQWAMQKFKLTQKDANGVFEIAPKVEFLRGIIKKVESL